MRSSPRTRGIATNARAVATMPTGSFGREESCLVMILFVLFPRVQGPLWGMPLDAYSGLAGLSDTMSPGSISQLSLIINTIIATFLVAGSVSWLRCP